MTFLYRSRVTGSFQLLTSNGVEGRVRRISFRGDCEEGRRGTKGISFFNNFDRFNRRKVKQICLRNYLYRNTVNYSRYKRLPLHRACTTNVVKARFKQMTLVSASFDTIPRLLQLSLHH